jgi:hypothetical protein
MEARALQCEEDLPYSGIMWQPWLPQSIEGFETFNLGLIPQRSLFFRGNHLMMAKIA